VAKANLSSWRIFIVQPYLCNQAISACCLSSEKTVLWESYKSILEAIVSWPCYLRLLLLRVKLLQSFGVGWRRKLTACADLLAFRRRWRRRLKAEMAWLRRSKCLAESRENASLAAKKVILPKPGSLCETLVWRKRLAVEAAKLYYSQYWKPEEQLFGMKKIQLIGS